MHMQSSTQYFVYNNLQLMLNLFENTITFKMVRIVK